MIIVRLQNWKSKIRNGMKWALFMAGFFSILINKADIMSFVMNTIRTFLDREPGRFLEANLSYL